MPQPPAVTALADELTAVYARAWQHIVDEQARIAADPARWRRQARLRELEASISRLTGQVDEQARTWISVRFPIAYQTGAIRSAGIVGTRFAWTTPHLDAVTSLAHDLHDDLLAATRHVNATTKALVRQIARDQALAAAVESKTAQQAAREMARILEDNGIHAVRYSNGARHGLADYADVAIRTKTAVAYNDGGIREAHAAGVDWFECFDGADCGLTAHDDAEKPNGAVYPIGTAQAWPIAHPRCQRSWSPRPDVTTAGQARTAKPSTTETQRADQAQAERDRAALFAARRARARRKAQSAAR